jgi:hypothetical protein
MGYEAFEEFIAAKTKVNSRDSFKPQQTCEKQAKNEHVLDCPLCKPASKPKAERERERERERGCHIQGSCPSHFLHPEHVL